MTPVSHVNNQNKPGTSFFREDIQGLRAIAVTSVVLYHAKLGPFSGGYVGVDVFFVISGYLITRLLITEAEDKGTINTKKFFARRILRLLPAVSLVLIFTVIASYFFYPPIEQTDISLSILAAATYASNFWFASKAVDYLGGDLKLDPALHTWSLSVEEQFYLVWPFIILAGYKLNKYLRARAVVAIIIGGITLFSFAACITVVKLSNPMAFFGSPFRAWEFAVGALVYIASSYWKNLSKTTNCFAAITGLIALFYTIICFNDQTNFPSQFSLLPVLGTSLVLLSGTGQPSIINHLLGNSALRVLGNLSYSWYLWHWPLITFSVLAGWEMDIHGRLLVVLISLGIAWVSYRWIENPVRFSPSLTQSSQKSWLLGLCLTLLTVGSSFAIDLLATKKIRSDQRLKLLETVKSLPAVDGNGCHAKLNSVKVPDCIYGDIDSKRTVFLIGDSHAAQWFPPLERITRTHHWRLVSLTKSACPMANIDILNEKLGRPYYECTQWRESVLARIKAEHPQLILLANSSGYILDGLGLDPDRWNKGINNMIIALRNTGASVVIFRDTPRPSTDIPACLSKAFSKRISPSICDFKKINAIPPIYRKQETDTAAELGRIEFLDMANAICHGDSCPSILNGTVTYRDTNHLSVQFSLDLERQLEIELLNTGLFVPEDQQHPSR